MREERTYVKMVIGQEIKVGDKVRSYDFVTDGEANAGCYVEGKVVAIENNTYKILVNKRVFSNEEKEVTGEGYIYPPINGTMSFMGGETCGVQKIKEKRKYVSPMAEIYKAFDSEVTVHEHTGEVELQAVESRPFPWALRYNGVNYFVTAYTQENACYRAVR